MILLKKILKININNYNIKSLLFNNLSNIKFKVGFCCIYFFSFKPCLPIQVLPAATFTGYLLISYSTGTVFQENNLFDRKKAEAKSCKTFPLTWAWQGPRLRPRQALNGRQSAAAAYPRVGGGSESCAQPPVAPQLYHE